MLWMPSPGLSTSVYGSIGSWVGVGVLLDVQVLLDVAAGIGQERPLRAHLIAELVGLQDVVGGDRDDLGVHHGDLRVVRGQLQVLLVILGAEAAAGEQQNHRVDTLQLAQPPPGPGVIGQLVVGECPAGHDIGAHGLLLLEGDICHRGLLVPVQPGEPDDHGSLRVVSGLVPAGEAGVAQLDEAAAVEADAELDEDGAVGDRCRDFMTGPVMAARDRGAVVVMDGPDGLFGLNSQVKPGLVGDVFGAEFAAEHYRAAVVVTGADLLA